ncbi:MAG: MoxR family ATPase [Clostridiales bacterium]|nr:MoxR family ATPase [Clostridiales bacterium]
MSERTNEIINEIKKVICGKDYVILMTLTGILSGGHVLIEDVPGVGKTTMALAFSKTMGMDYGRVQFTPDVLPSDITGFSVYDKASQSMKYQPGSIFHNLFLADELNRASSRTQSALLEAMEEGQVTVDGNTYLLPKPFVVFATQNPSGASGTSLLPDSQMDRFAIRISMGYPSAKDEKAMLETRKNGNNPMSSIERICSSEILLQMQDEVNQVFINDKVLDYIVALVGKTRTHKDLERGASPRATLALTSMSRAYAYLFHRNYVVPSDVQAVFAPVMCHRLLLTAEAEVNEKRTADVAKDILKTTPEPKV